MQRDHAGACSGEAPRSGSGLRDALLVLGSVIASLLLLEAGLRLYHGVRWAYAVHSMPPLAQRAVVPSTDPELVYEWNPGWSEAGFSVNAYGMADRTVTLEKPSDTFRIAILGDSITANFRLLPRGDETYVAPLRAALERALGPAPRVETLDFAANGYSMLQSVRTLEVRALRFAPDLVIFQLCLNDPYPSDSVYTPLRNVSPSRLWDLVQRRLAPNRFWADRLVEKLYDAEGVENLRRGFQRIAAATQGGPPVLTVLFPYLYAPAYSDWDFERFHAAFRDAAAAAGVPLLDLYASFRDAGLITMDGFPRDSVHPDARGHAFAATQILAELERRHFVPAPRASATQVSGEDGAPMR